MDRLRRDARAAAARGRRRCRSSTTASTRAEPPFDDVRVRQAFGEAVDWRRIGRAGRVRRRVRPGRQLDGPARRSRAGATRTSCRRTTRRPPARCSPRPAIPGGAGFPTVTILTTGGTGFDEAIVDEVERELGIDARSETMEFDGYFDRLTTDPPAIWSLGWVADYPGRNDFLGVLLGDRLDEQLRRLDARRRSTPRSPRPVAATDPAAAAAAYDRAEAIVRDEVPVVPVAYGTGWALSRDGPAGRRPERARHPPDGRPGVGGLMAPSAAGSSRRWLGAAARRRPRAVAAGGRRRAPTSGRRPRRRRSASGVDFSQPVTVDRAGRAGRAPADLRRRDRPDVIEVPGPAGRGRADADATALDRPSGAHPARTRRSTRRWRLVAAATAPTPASGRRSRDRLRGRPVRLEDRVAGDLVRVHWYEGGDAFGQRALQDRRGRRRDDGRSCSA